MMRTFKVVSGDKMKNEMHDDLNIIELDQNNDVHINWWNEFLRKTPHLIIHTPHYKEFMDRSFNQTKTQYLAVVSAQEIKLVLPVQLISHPILGNKIISSAFLEYGSFAGEENGDYVEKILNYLEETYSKDYSYLEIRQGLVNFNVFLEKNLIKRQEYKRFELKLFDLDTNWQLIQKEKRKAIKKSESEGVVVKEVNLEQLDEIYSLYCTNMRTFGSPCFSKDYFKNFFELNLGKCFGAFYDAKLISLLVGFCYQDRIHLIIAVSDESYLWSRCNDAMHWHFIKYAIKNNYKTVDFGRVRPASGQFDYKQKWGCELKDLDHFYGLYHTKKLPDEDPQNPKFRLLSKVWSFLPLALTKKVGPWAREGTGK